MAGVHLGGGHAFDAGGAMHGGGLDRHLPAQPGARLNAHGVQGDGQKARSHLLARRHHHVIFALVRDRLGQTLLPGSGLGGLVGPGHQLVGLARHGRDHHGDLVAALDLALDQRGDMADALADRPPRCRRISSQSSPFAPETRFALTAAAAYIDGAASPANRSSLHRRRRLPAQPLKRHAAIPRPQPLH